MAGAVSRWLAVVVAIGYVIAALLFELGPPADRVQGGAAGRAAVAVAIGVGCLFPLAMIWFPDFFGGLVGGRITRETPDGFVAVGGWLVLLGVPLAFVWSLNR